MDSVLSPDLPFSLQLELTSRCNLRCQMCPLTTKTSSSSAAPGPISETTWDRVAPVARRSRQVFVAGYGEPLTNPQCLDILRDLDAHGVSTSMASNGLSITAANASELAALVHFAELNVSIDSPDPDVFREIRAGSLDRALVGLAHALDALGPARVTVSAVLMRQNAASLVELPELLAAMGVQRLSIAGVMNYNDYARDSSLLGEVGLTPAIDAIRERAEEHGLHLSIGAAERLALELEAPEAARARFHDRPRGAVTRQCMVPWEIPFVDKDGRVFACCNAASADQRQVGDLNEDAFEDIWVGDAFRAFRADLLDGDRAPEICGRCSLAPLGEHPLRTWAADLVAGSLSVRRGVVTFGVRNVGTRTWTSDDLVRVGMREGDAGCAHPSWLFPQRAATFVEDHVGPGEVATFTFAVTPARHEVVQRFHLVVEGVLWIPGFAVSVRIPGDRFRRFRSHPPRVGDRRGFAASIEEVEVGDDRVRVSARNTGTHGWTPGDLVRVGTAEPRDVPSPLADASWLQPNRPGSFVERHVPVGARATFEFALATAEHPAPQAFQLVAEGACWLDGTTFVVDGRRRNRR